MLSGQLPSRIGAYDNAAEFPASIPTFLHYLRILGYHTALSGKMHFVGPDQLHGYEERLTTDIYPSDFGWTPDWSRSGPPLAPSGMSMRSVVESGVCKRSLQLDYDEAVTNSAIQKIFDLARDPERHPFFFTVSLTHPHNPFIISKRYWDIYAHDSIDMPSVGNIPYEDRDEHSKRLYYLFRQDEHLVTDENVRSARHAYYGMISYVDDKIGMLLDALDDSGLAGHTVVIFVADHGEMLGERGLWYKFCLFEPACRIPFIICPPWDVGVESDQVVSLLDLFPTVLDLAGDGKVRPVDMNVQGQSVFDHFAGSSTGAPKKVACEFMAEGSTAPCVMLRDGRFKYIYSETDHGQLFDLKNDPYEQRNLSGEESHTEVEREFLANIDRDWNLAQLRSDIIQSQQRRLAVQRALHTGMRNPWDFQPFTDASQVYVRSGKSPTEVKGRARLPYIDPRPPDYLRAK